jgi:ankyrin repeat protein
VAAGQEPTSSKLIAFVRNVGRIPVAEITKDDQLATVAAIGVVERRIDFFNAPDENGATALMLAARNGWQGVVETLVTNGADPRLAGCGKTQ